MPTPAKTSDDAILAAARDILERTGTHGFSLNEVAAAVGVRTPSLYKHITDRAALLATLEQRGFAELGQLMRQSAQDPDPLPSMARAYRQFAIASPRLYARMLAPDATVSADALRWRQDAVAPVIATLTSELGAARALAAARTLTTFLHGWTTMESTGAFRLGGDLAGDFETALAAVMRGVRTMT